MENGGTTKEHGDGSYSNQLNYTIDGSIKEQHKNKNIGNEFPSSSFSFFFFIFIFILHLHLHSSFCRYVLCIPQAKETAVIVRNVYHVLYMHIVHVYCTRAGF